MPDHTDAHPVHGWHHAGEVLISNDYPEEVLVEDVVPLLANTLQAIPLIIPAPGYRCYNLIILTFRLPLGAEICVKAHVLDGLPDGDV